MKCVAMPVAHVRCRDLLIIGITDPAVVQIANGRTLNLLRAAVAVRVGGPHHAVLVTRERLQRIVPQPEKLRSVIRV